MFILYGFAMEVSCCVMTIVLRPMCLPWNASLTSSLVLFFTLCDAAQSSSITRLLVFFANLTISREYFGILQVLPVLVSLVILERRAHDEIVVKVVRLFFSQHFQEVVCFPAGRHTGYDHVKWRVLLFISI